MAGSLQARIKTWVSTEDVTYSDLNAEFDNLLTAMQPLLIDDYSTNVTQMQVIIIPGEVGTESLATTLAGELARLRFVIGQITGEDEWYESPVSSLLGLSNAVGTGLTDNRIVSGRVRSGSANPTFLVPNGAARTIKCDGTPTNFIYYIAGIEYTISTDVTLTGLTAAPSSNNTCLVNDTVAADQDYTKHAGEYGTEIPIDTAGSEISALIGKFAAFKLDNGSATEYFTAYVTSATSLTKAKRGYFFDSSDNPIPRIVYSNNDTITLLKLTWVFATTTGTLTATYNNPVWSDDEPSSPAIGDYWFDYSANVWKVYGVGSYSTANAMLIGISVQDTTNTIGARSFELFANYDALNTVEVVAESNTQVKSKLQGSVINAYGETIKNDGNLHTWDMTIDLDSGVTEAASTYYYFYITETGDKIISDVRPHDRSADLMGFYHPHRSWRCVGYAFNNGSQNLSAVNSFYYSNNQSAILPAQTAASKLDALGSVIPLDTSGGAFTKYLPPVSLTRDMTFKFHKTTSDFTAATVSTVNSENIITGTTSATTITVNTIGEQVEVYSDGTSYYAKRYIPSQWTAYTPTFGAGFGTVSVQEFYWRRDGDSILIRGSWTNGTVSASVGTVSLPSGLTSATTTLRKLCGTGGRQTNATVIWSVIISSAVTTLSLSVFSTASTDPTTEQNGNTISSTGDICFLTTSPIGINGWGA